MRHRRRTSRRFRLSERATALAREWTSLYMICSIRQETLRPGSSIACGRRPISSLAWRDGVGIHAARTLQEAGGMTVRIVVGALGALMFGWGAFDGLRRRRFWMGGNFGRTYVITRRANPLRFWLVIATIWALAMICATWASV